MSNQVEGDALDILNGVAAIAEFLGQPKYTTQYQIDRGYWPVFRVGKLIRARKSELANRASARSQQGSSK